MQEGIAKNWARGGQWEGYPSPKRFRKFRCEVVNYKATKT